MSPEVRRAVVAQTACTRCGAAPGSECRTPSNHIVEPHRARVLANLFRTHRQESPTA